MDPARDVCAGCYRTLEEIARWRDMSDTQRLEVLASIAQRRTDDHVNVSLTIRKLP